MGRRSLSLAIVLWLPVLFIGPGAGLTAGAADLRDAEACLVEPLPAQQIACLSRAAIAAGNPKICLRTELPGARWPCVALYADFADDPSLCDILPESEDVPASVSRDLCHVQLAVSRRDPSLCEDLATPNLGDGCYYQLVEIGGDPALCDRIANPEVKTVCAFDPKQVD